jgi:hypothetical protein
MYSRFASIALKVADWHIAKERPSDLFAGTFWDIRAKVKELKDKLAIEARDSLQKAVVKDLTDRKFEVISAAFALGQYRGSKFMTSAKLSVKVGTAAKAEKMAAYLLKFSPKYHLKAFDPATGIADFNIR